jgi:hypothetical protein
MVSKTSSVRSIRLPNDMWAWLAAEAERRGTTVNGLVSDLLEVGRLGVAERAAAPVKPARALKAAPPKVKAEPAKLAVPFGPQPVAPGSRLKKR